MNNSILQRTVDLNAFGSVLLKKLKTKRKKIHCMTNYVSATACANLLLAVGASPIMADAPEEADEITRQCDALMLNAGTLNQSRFVSMLMAAESAKSLNHPIIFDPVACGASQFRSAFAVQLLQTVTPTVIKGNLSEIYAIANKNYSYVGIDSDQTLNSMTIQNQIRLAKHMATSQNCIIVITGKSDIVTDGKSYYLIHNGHEMMGLTTGTGCMLSALIASYCAAEPKNIFTATALATAVMGLCGELAANKTAKRHEGTGSFYIYLIDYLSSLSPIQLEKGLKYAYFK